MGKRESERDVSSNDVQLVCDALQLNRSNEANGGNINTCKHTHTHTHIHRKKLHKIKKVLRASSHVLEYRGHNIFPTPSVSLSYTLRVSLKYTLTLTHC